MHELITRLNADEMLRRHGAYYTTRIAIVSGVDEYRLDIDLGKVSEASANAPDCGFRLVASHDVWDKYCQDIPPPEFHELGALVASGHVSIEGDMYALQSNFMFVRRLLEIWRIDQRQRMT